MLDCYEQCNETDSCLGHYTCGPNNEKLCLKFWTGPDCTVRVHPDPQNDRECPLKGPCRGTGSCFQQSCCCPAGFTGTLCEVEIYECESNPCQNGATCYEPGPAMYKCQCPNGEYYSSIIILMSFDKINVLDLCFNFVIVGYSRYLALPLLLFRS